MPDVSLMWPRYEKFVGKHFIATVACRHAVDDTLCWSKNPSCLPFVSIHGVIVCTVYASLPSHPLYTESCTSRRKDKLLDFSPSLGRCSEPSKHRTTESEEALGSSLAWICARTQWWHCALRTQNGVLNSTEVSCFHVFFQ